MAPAPADGAPSDGAAADGARDPSAPLDAYPGIGRGVRELCRRVADDPVLAAHFVDNDPDRLGGRLAALLAGAVGGRRQSPDPALVAELRELHLPDAVFDRVLGHLNAALVDAGVEDRTIGFLLRTVAGMRPDIVPD